MHWGEPGCQPQRQVRWCALVEPQQGLGGPMLGAEGTETEGGSGQALIPSSATDWLYGLGKALSPLWASFSSSVGWE